MLKNGKGAGTSQTGGAKGSSEDVKEARAQGDLSENFEYKAAKKVKP